MSRSLATIIIAIVVVLCLPKAFNHWNYRNNSESLHVLLHSQLKEFQHAQDIKGHLFSISRSLTVDSLDENTTLKNDIKRHIIATREQISVLQKATEYGRDIDEDEEDELDENDEAEILAELTTSLPELLNRVELSIDPMPSQAAIDRKSLKAPLDKAMSTLDLLEKDAWEEVQESIHTIQRRTDDGITYNALGAGIGLCVAFVLFVVATMRSKQDEPGV